MEEMKCKVPSSLFCSENFVVSKAESWRRGMSTDRVMRQKAVWHFCMFRTLKDRRLAIIFKFQVAVCHEDKGTENLIATLRELQL